MAILTSYQCDRCQQVYDKLSDCGHKVELFVSDPHYSDKIPVRKALWCKNCVAELAIRPNPRLVQHPGYTPPTLEDLIREIAEDAARQVQSEG